MKPGIVPPMTAPVSTDKVGSPVKHKMFIGFSVMNILCIVYRGVKQSDLSFTSVQVHEKNQSVSSSVSQSVSQLASKQKY